MRRGRSRIERHLKTFERNAASAERAGLLRIRVEDVLLAGDTVTIDGRKLINFGSCAYLGLNTDPRLKAGAIGAIKRLGPVFSSSTVYTSADLYTHLEDALVRILNAAVVVPTTTTLGHLGALPVLVGRGDAVVIDMQAHESLHLATGVLMGQGTPVKRIRHNDLEAFDTAVAALAETHERVWYLADGIYSMFGDVAPVQAIHDRFDRFENLHVYYDDAHGFGWQGAHGRGHVLSQVPWHQRMVVSASLSKSFGSGGAVIAFGNPHLARRVLITGGTFTFSGPLHPAELGAAVVSAAIHLSDEHAERRARLLDHIALVTRLVDQYSLPVPARDVSPIWFVDVGEHWRAVELGVRMMKAGFYLNISSYPAVPRGHSGLRFTNTLFQSSDQIESMLHHLARHLHEVNELEEITIDLTAEEEVPARRA